MIFKVQRYACGLRSQENNYLFEQNMVIFNERVLGIFLFHFFFYVAGFHLSATVNSQGLLNGVRSQFNVAVTFDRRKITSCNCTCSSKAYWCAHVVAVCLHRIHMVNKIILQMFYR